MNFIEKLKSLATNASLLIVEDDKDLNEELCDYFSIFFPKVDTVFGGLEGLNKAKEFNYNIILTDFNMPQMDGLSMIKNIKLIEENSSEFILLSGQIEDYEDIIKELNVKYILSKPFDFDYLCDYIIKCLEKG